MEALWTSDANGLARFECYQPQYSLVVRDIEQELIPFVSSRGGRGGVESARRRLSVWQVQAR